MKYETRNHSKFLLMYHVIFVCKYRKVILEPISEELKQIMFNISKESNFEILEMETDKDHIHFLIKGEPKERFVDCQKIETRIYKQVMENTKGISGKILLG